MKVHLVGQPIEILAMLLERPGRVVTRDELRTRLWPADTFVEFEHSLNAAVMRLRQALGDDAERPAFVETVPRRGYRFLGAVNMHDMAFDAGAFVEGFSSAIMPAVKPGELAQPPKMPKKRPPGKILMVGIVLALLVLAAALAVIWHFVH